MEMNRRQFVGTLSAGAAGLALVGMSGCNTTALQEVLNLLPTVGEIISSVGNVIAAIDPALGGPISAALQIIGASFTNIQAIINSYKNNIAGIPPTILNELDAAVAAVATQMTAIEAEIPSLPAIYKVAIQVVLDAFQAILGYLAQVIPASAASMFPKSGRLLQGRHIFIGQYTGAIPERRYFAQTYNARMTDAGFPKAHIHVPWLWHLIP
jgi:hypothetical protein